MKNAIRWFLLLLAPAIVYADFDAGIVSLQSLYTPETAVLNPALADLWTEGEDGGFFSFMFRIEPDGGFGYQVEFDQKVVMTLHLVPLGSEIIADMVFKPLDSFPPQLPVHFFARLRVDGNVLHVDLLGGDKLLDQIRKTGSPRHEMVTDGDWEGGALILPGSTAELRRFILDCLGLPDAFGASTDMTVTFNRAGPEKRAKELNQKSWDVVRRQGRDPEAYALALRQAEEAVRLVPDDPDYWNTLAAAQYRSGRFSEALSTLAQAAQLRKSDNIEDLVFRAMSHQQLGQKDQAKIVLLGELSKLLGDPLYVGSWQRYCGRQDGLDLLREAEDLIVPKAK